MYVYISGLFGISFSYQILLIWIGPFLFGFEFKKLSGEEEAKQFGSIFVVYFFFTF